MPLSLVHRVPSTAHALFSLDEEEQLIPACRSLGGSEVEQRIGPYTVTEHIGAGASGSNVFAAWRDSPSELVALKVLDDEHTPTKCALPRFRREAEVVCGLGAHPHLVSGLDRGESDGHHYVAMKLLRGTTAHSLLHARGRLDWREATRLTLDVARGLTHLSRRCVVHRDIKPENIMVCGQGEAAIAVLIDFGLARRTDGEDDPDDDEGGGGGGGGRGGGSGLGNGASPPAAMRRVCTPAYSAIGTPAFMAPEQVQDARNARPASDVYALGATYYTCMTGVLPFDGASPVRVMQQVLSGEVLPPSARVTGVPAAVEAAMLWMLQKEPRARPPSGDALVALLEDVLRAPHDEQRVRDAQRAHARRRAREDAVRATLCVVGCVLIILMMAWVMCEASELRPSTPEEHVVG
jgi:serine/threonine protein kinase